MQNSLPVIGDGKLGAVSPGLRCRPFGDREQGIVVIDKILEELPQGAFPSIVRHQPNADVRPEFRYVADKSFKWNLIRQIELDRSEAIANRAPSISWLPVGIQKEPYGSAVADTDGWFDAFKYGVPVACTSYLGHIRSEFAWRARVPREWTVDAMPKQEMLDGMHVVSALDVKLGAFDGRHQRTSISCSTATLIWSPRRHAACFSEP